jgi:hypothetical protein
MPRFEFKSETFQWFYPIIFVSCGESRLLVSWCVGGRCDMVGSDDDLGKSRRLGAEDWGGSSTGRVLDGGSSTGRVLDGWMIGRSGNIMCGLHHAHGDE